MYTTLVAAVGIAVLPVLITLGVSGWQDHQRHRRERYNVRLLIQMENERNLRLLRGFWTEVQQHALPVGSVLGFSTEEVMYLKRYKLASDYLPPWGHLLWESHAAQLASALGRDELEQTYELHATLDTFSTHRAHLLGEFNSTSGVKLWHEYQTWRERASQSAIVSGQLVPSFEFGGELVAFNQLTDAAWTACEGIANGTATRGNPVHADTAPHEHRASLQRFAFLTTRLQRRAPATPPAASH